MGSDAELAVKWLLRELNRCLRPFGFKRRGQTFARQSDDCWQVVNVQLSAYSTHNEKSLTVNFGVQAKSALRFRDEDPSKPPRHYACPIRFRVSWLLQRNDVWWAVQDGLSARAALAELVPVLESKGIPFLDSLRTAEDILRLFDSGHVLGFEIDRDETRLLLLAEKGAREEVLRRLDEFQSHWPFTPAAERASKFLKKFRSTYAFTAD